MARGVGGEGMANVMQHLKGIEFPASKEEILSTAQGEPGPDTDDVMNLLEQLPEGDIIHRLRF